MKLIPRRRKALFMLICCGFLSILVYISINFIHQEERCFGSKCFHVSSHHVNTYSSSCHLPRLDPFDKSILHLITNYSQNSTTLCPGTPKIFKLVRGRIHVRDNSLLQNVLKKSVKYETIERPQGIDYAITYGDEIFIFKTNKKPHRIQSDFVKVSYRMEDRSRKVEMFKQIVPKKGVQKHFEENQLNVILMGFDSTSNANFKRKLPKSYNHLVEKLQAFVFNGYSIIGDGTTPALTAMLTGKSMTGKILRSVHDSTEGIDNWPWIMKDYREKGYVTLYAEDDPQISSFNVQLHGFGAQPADHYIRPFWLSVEQHGLNGHRRNKTDSLHRVCFNNEPLHNITLDYVMKFLEAYRETPKFAFSYFSYLPHGTGEKLSLADEDLSLFLKNYEEYHQNTILIFFGDHGARIGPIRNTIQGTYEEHLPWLSIVVPPWFHQKYPDLVKNMKHNQNIITTPFDVHNTLHHILELGKNPADIPGMSLFLPLNSQRSCADAGVDDHWCPCLNWKRTDIASTHIQAAAHMLVHKINNVIGKRSLLIHICFTIYLVEILLAARVHTTTTNSRKNTYLQVTIATNPGGGIFQATFYMDADSKLTINPHISRTNKYGKKPWCLPQSYHSMRKFCTCKQEPPTKRVSKRHKLEA